MNKIINKNYVVSLILFILISAILYRITPVYVEENIKVVVSKNKVNITSIYQPREITNTREVMLDKLNLFHKGKFGHAKLGNFAKASEDFFVDIDQMFTISRDATYQFLAGSDDGFLLKIDNKTICEFIHDRPYSIQPCSVFLSKGKHRLQASYFQGFGNSGFTLQYQTPSGKTWWFGENSPELKLN